MQTALPDCSSASFQIRPAVSAHCWAMKNCAVVPFTVVCQLAALCTASTEDCACGATARTPATCSWIASTSDISKSGACAPPPPRPKPWPGRICRMFAPRLEICSATAAVAPLPSVTMVTTAATPITMPSTVRKERSMCRRISRTARMMVVKNISRAPPLVVRSARCFRSGRRGNGRWSGHRPPCRARASPSAR